MSKDLRSKQSGKLIWKKPEVRREESPKKPPSQGVFLLTLLSGFNILNPQIKQLKEDICLTTTQLDTTPR